MEATSGAPVTTTAPAPTAAPDAGTEPAPSRVRDAVEATATRVVCREDWSHQFGVPVDPGNCYFGGVIQTLRPASFGRERATRIVLGGEASPVACAVNRLRGGHQTGEEPDFRAEELLVTLEPGLTLPFARGDVVCGSVRVFPRDGSIDLDLAYEGLVAGPNGEVLLAYSRGVPRDGSPLPGWKFSFGRQRTFARPGVDVFNDYDMIVEHGGASAPLAWESGFVSLRTPEGVYRIRARGMRASGPLSDRYAVREKSRYNFTIARAAGE